MPVVDGTGALTEYPYKYFTLKIIFDVELGARNKVMSEIFNKINFYHESH